MVLTKYPLAQKLPGGIFLVFFLIQAEDFPFNTSTAYDTEYLGGISMSRWICSSPMCQALITKPFQRQIIRNILLNSALIYLSCITLPRYLGIQTKWYWQL